MDQTTWGALALTLTILAGAYTWWAYRHRGVRSAARGAAVTMLPPAAYLTGTLRMFGRITDAVVDWLTRLAFTPSVWIGFALLLLALVILGVSPHLSDRDRPRRTQQAKQSQRSRSTAPGAAQPAAVERTSARGRPALDDDMADIEALLRKRGIS